MLKYGGQGLTRLLADLFNDVLRGDQTPPATWKETRLTVLFKKGDAKCLENYRPVAILPFVYKLFSRILDARIRTHIAHEQSVDQAAFRPGFGCADHLFTLAQLNEKSA